MQRLEARGTVSLKRGWTSAHLLNALLLEDVGELADLGQQLGVGDLALILRIVAFPIKSDLESKRSIDRGVDGSDGGAIASNTMGPQFESRQIIISLRVGTLLKETC